MASDTVVGSPAWIERRRHFWTLEARRLFEAVKEYEDTHPDDAPCFAAIVDAMKRQVPDA